MNYRTCGQSDRVSDAHHHEERQGDRGHVVGLRRLRQHGLGGRHRVRVHAGRQEDHQTRSDPSQRKQHHHGKH